MTEEKVSSASFLRVVGPSFVAGIELKDGKIVRAAPVLKGYIGKKVAEFASVCERKGWKIETVD